MVDKVDKVGKVSRAIKDDCLLAMPHMENGSVDMIICDLCYGVSDCKWDIPIPFDVLWRHYERLIKSDGVIVLTATQPFTSALVMSNPQLFKYEIIWEKSKASNFLQVKRQVLKAHENVLIFAKGPHTYNPQKTSGKPYSGKNRAGKKGSITDVYANVPNPLFRRGSKDGSRYPRSVQYFKTAESEGKQLHPTQKPIALFEYLIKTFSNEGELVLDNCAGSFTTAVACDNLNRAWVCIEKDEEYYRVGTERVNQNRIKLGIEEIEV